ncbi:hypothetical protein IB279_32970 [Ensifer sp. ENS06]|jgi:hypothetical protein|uniref:hypothetical protein n=1 Tax=unclassified Ensifer TaxID=2633371 RepID=UPI00072AE1DF|nr:MULTISPECIES: hypothetical protein [unclassified Ensifer]KSV68891.1 hypothetical protein N185_28945 [Sinorhizobium sp. GW3]MBD9524091.1 hypothetical protein [Ensifer sp. ENS02]MBD9627770.1 hypothetical protein [Ensifer sp. ENS06]MCY1746196.1 hypothetical protein [Ensifer sp. SL37]
MTIVLSGRAIELHGACGVEDAEELLTALEAKPRLPVSLVHAGDIHTAVWQLILLCERDLEGEPASDFAVRYLLPTLKNRKVK